MHSPIKHTVICLFLFLIRPNGSVFSVAAQNVQVEVKTGDVVTFSYESNSRRDAPVNPTIYRVRTDLSWDDVVLNFRKEKRQLNSIISIREIFFDTHYF